MAGGDTEEAKILFVLLGRIDARRDRRGADAAGLPPGRRRYSRPASTQRRDLNRTATDPSTTPRAATRQHR